ncbi:MAG: DUF3536 domain-containing protein [Saprospiraceae bacterium]|nr:DUF3536 domain-containing protein [Saprospiraceae bacterium]
MNAHKYLCIHGHFYQPPRENAWLDIIEVQDSAAPFHDWNERINFECYAPNAAARILSADHKIIDIVNNYAKISFNFGPTLLSWMEKADPLTYKAIQDADVLSREQFDGHGSAVAQVYGHLIMPLANDKDKETQIIWGIRDFEFRFGRRPEGMWLAETAVDIPTLELLATYNISFTILAPQQAKAFRKIGATEWTPLPTQNIDTRRPYQVQLPSGKTMALFFYDGEIAQGVAFKGLLNSGKNFAHTLIRGFDPDDSTQLVHIATDGESYGHHHRHGEMALADCLEYIEKNQLATLTNYGAYLAQFPPEYEVQIHENSSWSCVHGIERWRANCGCNTGGNSGWNQHWRKPLRETLNWLRDSLIPIFEQEGAHLLQDVWAARNDYVELLFFRKKRPEVIDQFFARHASRPLNPDEQTQTLRLLEMQFQAMQMFTSCGWFFDEVSGLETNQILQYAYRAIEYAKQVSHLDLHQEFQQRLTAIPSNIYDNGAHQYIRQVIPSSVNLHRVGIHYAVQSIFDPYTKSLDFFNFCADSEVFEKLEAGQHVLVMGRTHIHSKVTRSQKHFSFAALYLGQQNIVGNLSTQMPLAVFTETARRLSEAFQEAELGKVIGTMQQQFQSDKFSFSDCFHDVKRQFLQRIIDEDFTPVNFSMREIYKHNYQTMSVAKLSGLPVPQAYVQAVSFVIQQDMKQHFSSEPLSLRTISRFFQEIERWNIHLMDDPELSLIVGERIYREIRQLDPTAADFGGRVALLDNILKASRKQHYKLDLWKSQNLAFSLLHSYPETARQTFAPLAQELDLSAKSPKT